MQVRWECPSQIHSSKAKAGKGKLAAGSCRDETLHHALLHWWLYYDGPHTSQLIITPAFAVGSGAMAYERQSPPLHWLGWAGRRKSWDSLSLVAILRDFVVERNSINEAVLVPGTYNPTVSRRMTHANALLHQQLFLCQLFDRRRRRKGDRRRYYSALEPLRPHGLRAGSEELPEAHAICLQRLAGGQNEHAVSKAKAQTTQHVSCMYAPVQGRPEDGQGLNGAH
jgi:hypothetical protein